MNYTINTLGILSGGSIGLLIGVIFPLFVTYAIRYLTGYDAGVQLSGFYAILTGPIGLILGARYGFFLSKIVNESGQSWHYLFQGFQGWAISLFFLLGLASVVLIIMFVDKI